ncbi:MAG: M20 family metallo-hydrolase [Desulfovibrionales bacterium]
MFEQISQYLDEKRDEVIRLQKALVPLKGLGPDNDGPGEWDKADFLLAYLREIGVPELQELPAPDDRAERGSRPNIAARMPGRSQDRTFWIIAHTDIVPSGDLSLWNTDPFTLAVDGDFVIGRGVEDNHQGMVSGILVMEALLKLNITPRINFGLLLVADEETGSKYGLDYVVRHHPELFTQDDLFLVPDFGNPTSDMVEVAEKSMLWLKLTVKGRQCHASTPQEGINSLVAAADLILRVKGLTRDFGAQDKLFAPPHSTFEPTRKEPNVPNINTIPGLDVFYLDCRILPEYDVEDVIRRVREYADETAARYSVSVDIETVQKEIAAPPTDPKSEVVTRLCSAIETVYAVTGKPTGIGGGTVAAFLRRQGYKAAVWSTLIHNAHQPNEHSSISKTIGDAQVMAHMALG